ncbi:Gfo/Idh/MocA family protein [Litorimonas sp. WD9-15]|uniref:Gfo/Idh/MocA family protein n=1 Tax=Litorimonas sp. WD9-15 TaxID=3418716 RepID=UPI003CFDCB00
MIRIGLLGASKIAPKAIITPTAAREDCIIQAVASRDPERARLYANEHSIPYIENSYEALIARDDIDLIYNALPPNRHCELSLLAAEHGKAVLCEKPFAMNSDEARRMVDAAKKAGTVLIEAFHYRYHPAFLDFEALVASGKLGKTEEIRGVFNVHIPNRDGELRYISELGGGALMDLGCYPLHAMRTLLGVEPTVISAENHYEDTHDVAVASVAELDFGGVPGFLECDMSPSAIYENHIDVIGSRGTARMTRPVHPYRWNPHLGFEIATVIDGEKDLKTLLNSPETYKRSTYAYQLDHVVSVMNGDVAALTGGADAIANMAAINAILSR